MTSTVLALILLLAADGAVVAPEAKVERVAEGYKFTEGPARGPDGAIYFTDIPNNQILRHHPADGRTEVFRSDSGGANGLMFDAQGRLVICEGKNRRVTRLAGDKLEVLAEKSDGKRLNSPNDLAIDAKGGIYFTDPRYGERETMEMTEEAVYYIRPEGGLMRIIHNLKRPNGIMLSPDGKKLYVVDNGASQIWAYDVKDSGAVTDGKILIDDMGGDGMTVDTDGRLYIAGQGAVWVWGADGSRVTKIAVPESPSNCTFGGEKNQTLFITARKGFYRIPLLTQGGR